jgi:hypothetical protein
VGWVTRSTQKTEAMRGENKAESIKFFVRAVWQESSAVYECPFYFSPCEFFIILSVGEWRLREFFIVGLSHTISAMTNYDCVWPRKLVLSSGEHGIKSLLTNPLEPMHTIDENITLLIHNLAHTRMRNPHDTKTPSAARSFSLRITQD